MSAEYLMAHGNHQVILCERGIRTFENSTRSTLDLSSVAVAKQMTHLPIIVDPSHAAGRKDIIPALSKASVAIGADGLLIDRRASYLPADAKCDGKQALLPSELETLARARRDCKGDGGGRYELGISENKIDHLNAEIIGLFSERLKIAKEIAKIKKERIFPHDPVREQEQLQVLRDLAKLHGLSPAVIEEIFTLFVDYSKINMKMEIGQ